MNIPVLYQDQDFIAVNKPAGLPVHKTLDTNRLHLQGLLEAQEGQSLVLFHRLDLDTTGVVLFGKNAAVNRDITDAFRERKMKKTYWAVVDGRWLEEWKTVKSYIVKKVGGHWRNAPRGSLSEEALSSFQILASSGAKTLLEVKPQTGRTHQIRLHCELKKHPILGDSLYGKKDSRPMALHALELQFCHPLTKKDLTIRAPLPDYWSKVWLKGLPHVKAPV